MKKASIDMVVSLQWGETIFKGTFLSLFTFVVLNNVALAEVFYYVNYVNVNYSVKNSTVDCKYLLYFL